VLHNRMFKWLAMPVAACCLVGLARRFGICCMPLAPHVKEVDVHLANALEALAKNDDGTARRELEFVIRIHPNDSEAHVARGVLFYKEGRWYAAKNELRRALELNPRDATANAFASLTQLAMGKPSKALLGLRGEFRAARRGDLQRVVGLGLVQCQLNLNHSEGAALTLHRLIQLYPDDPDVLYEASQVYSNLWNQSVLALYKQAPDSWQFHRISGQVLESEGRFSDAAVEYRIALSINPHVPGLHFRLGRCLLLSSHDPSILREAGEQFKAELEVSPYDSSAEYELGQIAWVRHDSSKALVYFQRSAEMNSAFVEAYVGLGKVYLEDGQPQRAIVELEKAVRLAPRNVEAHYRLMLAYRNAGRIEDAEHAASTLRTLRQGEQESETVILTNRWYRDGKDQTGVTHR
jgi:Flp pilus assembly protein TadD